MQFQPKNELFFKKPQFYSKVFVFLFIMGIYSRYHLNLPSGIFIPNIISLIGGLGLLVSQGFRIRKNILIYFLGFTMLNLLLFGLGYITVGYNLIEVAKSFILFEVSVFFALVFYQELIYWRNEDLVQFYKKLTYFIIFLCFLDLFPIIHDLNMQIMGKQVMNVLENDRNFFFGTTLHRPYPLTTEPSHAAKLLFVVMPSWLYLSHEKDFKRFFLLCFVTLVIIRSPIILGIIGLGFLFFLAENKFKKTHLNYFAIGLILIILIVLSSIAYLNVLGPRAVKIISGTDASTYARVVRPWFVVKEVLLNHPFFGAGMGNTEYLAYLYQKKYLLLSLEGLDRGYLVFALLAPLAYMGLFGFIGHFFLVVRFLKPNSKRSLKFYLIVHYLLISISMGAFLTINYWGYLFILFRVYSNIFPEKSSPISYNKHW
ncbi:MAG: hypothetical protein FH748_09195 [Balneolaceae bacterium]|nr:hypothetical protein [Balneolaceae bacterium]